MGFIANLKAFIRISLVHPGLLLVVFKIKQSKHTYLSYQTLYSLIRNFKIELKRYAKPVMVAEFGVGRGGSAKVLAWMVNQYGGKLTLYDVFGRIPAPTEMDGEKAHERYEFIINKEKDDYYGNISDLERVILNELYQICDPQKIEVIKGKYEEILPTLKDDKKFDLVHIDCDWYESSKTVYQYLHSRISNQAIIQIDDYSNWKGSNQAFQETDWLIHHKLHIVDGALVVDLSKK